MANPPLAERLRPSTLTDFVGQDHLTGKGGLISKLLEGASKTGFFPSLIFWGPPGCGKTTLARLIAKELKRNYFEFSAVNTSIREIEAVVFQKSSGRKDRQLTLITAVPYQEKASGTAVVFIDEIHRFNKAQQDALLPHVEKGDIVFLGATTENPSFEVIGPLLSRSRVVILNQLERSDILKIVERALDTLHVGLEGSALEFLLEASNGDARVVLNVLEIAANISSLKKLNLGAIEEALQRRQLNFDLQGEEYYNTISALHKTVRASDPNGALYYLARMLEAGQDPLYIARRLIRAASEDIGLADPQALVIANAAFEVCDKLGMPECNLALAEAVVYLAKAPKSNRLYLAYGEAAGDVKKYGNLPVPMQIRNPVTKLMKEVGYGKNYHYYHSPKGKKLPGEDFFPEKLKGRKYL